MILSARIQATIELLEQLLSTPRPADALVSAYFRGHRYIGSKDRAAVSQMFYGILRHTGRLTWWLEKLSIEITARTQMITYLALYDTSLHSPKDNHDKQKTASTEILKEIKELFDGKRYAPLRFDATERKLVEKLEGRTQRHPEMPEDIAVECPPWAAESLKNKFGPRFLDEMKAMLTPAPLDLRVNPLKANRDETFKSLKKQGFATELCLYAPYGLRIRERPSLSTLDLLKDGTLEIQDEGSQLVAVMMDAKPGERVVDFCAGAGGKTLAIAAQMQNKGRIVACDVLENRLKRSTERFKRAGFHNIEIKPLTHENDAWVKRHKGNFDRVLVDAPCSGTGTWRRNPDQRWRSLGPGLDKLLPLQASILDSASRLVKEGGRLVYATCSMLEEENERQIERFLNDHKEFKLVPLSEIKDVPDSLSKTGPYLSLSPASNKTDGFFAAAMIRIKTPEASTAENKDEDQ